MNGIEAIDKKGVGFVTRNKFAECIGVTPGVVRGWVQQDFVVYLKVGKWSLIDLEATAKLWREENDAEVAA